MKPLAGRTVVELSHSSIAARYATYVLALLGARVIELRGGEDRVAESPYLRYLSAGKETLEIDPTSLSWFDGVKPLLGGADVLVVADVAGASWGDEDPALADRAIKAGCDVVHLRQTTKDRLAGTTLITSAMTGAANSIGRADQSPLPVPADLCEYQSAVHLVGNVLLLDLQRSGAVGGGRREPRVVTLSDFRVALHAAVENVGIFETYGIEWRREGHRAAGSGGGYPYTVLPCADGYVTLVVRTQSEWAKFVEALGSPDWARQPRYQDFRRIGIEYADEVDVFVREWLADKTRGEVRDIGRKFGVPMGPVNGISDVLGDPQLAERSFFIDFEDSDLRLPGLPFGRGPQPAIPAVRPFDPLTPPVRQPVPVAPRSARHLPVAVGSSGPLEGIRVVDLSWTWSGPGGTGMLADLGAEVIRVESMRSMDPNRRRGIEKVGQGAPTELLQADLCSFDAFKALNRNKKSIRVDIKTPEGADRLRSLVAESDLVVENFTPGVVERLGFGWDEVHRINPDASMVSLSAMGRGGAISDMKGYGPIMSAYAGVEGLVGYGPDDVIGMMTVAYSDANATGWLVLAALAAIAEQQRTDEGQYVDMSQTEASAATLFAPLVRYQLTGEEERPRGARSNFFAPHGIYRARDGWLALVARSEGEWSALFCEIGSNLELPAEAAGWSRSDRVCRSREIDQAVSAWLTDRDLDSALHTLKSLGIGCAPVLSYDQALESRPCVEESVAVRTEHTLGGPVVISTVPWDSALVGEVSIRQAPMLGEHTVEIVEGLLGYPLSEGLGKEDR